MTPSEKVAIAEAIFERETAEAKGRMVAAHASSVKIPELSKGDARDKAAAAASGNFPQAAKGLDVTHTREQVITGWHEAGHAAMAYFLGRPVSLVSVRPTEHYRGITTWVSPKRRSELPLHLPAISWPAQIRRDIETSIAISLAARPAELMSGKLPPSGFVGKSAARGI